MILRDAVVHFCAMSPTSACSTLLEHCFGDAGGGEADALVDHLDAGIAGGDGDLLGTIAVAVEAGLADQHLEEVAELGIGVP